MMTKVRWQILGFALTAAATAAIGLVPGIFFGVMLFLVGGIILFVADSQFKAPPAGQLQRLRSLIDGNSKGVAARVDENRRLMEQLQLHFPEVFSTHQWMADVLHDNDHFFMALATQTCRMHLNNDGSIDHESGTIRAWPAAVPVRSAHPDTVVEKSAVRPLQRLTVEVQGLRQTSITRIIGELEHTIHQLQAGDRAGERHCNGVGYRFRLDPAVTGGIKWATPADTLPESVS